ncbi:L,D-transpeptidase family protein [Arcobacter roscoffensis]|uniref:L,D-transpeptidase family protein n=1 Tax=Arcobacter roscoffensis TaxID=2961520 RepID=A0ABY5E464_9BACT|nr:L,D-transpeptidase family protein [Arcobacter roscoffensis]UTJ05868.1 L,D-transpeptidase family protein [Arcobacter roscoffensis]
MFRLLFLISFLFTTNIFANKLIDLYRLEGITAVELELEKQLSKKDYWQETLKNYDTKFGYLESKKYILHSNKKEKKLFLYENKNMKLSKLFEDDVIIGEIEGDKYLEGDKKTPIGVYDLTKKRSNLDQFYGPFALVTSYPNNFDKSQNKKGHGIWIHGMPLNGDREEYTRGCIALNNENLLDLESKIDLEDAVLITSEEDFIEASKDELATILSSINKWKLTWKYSQINDYLSFYSNEFKRYNGMQIEEFSKYKKRVFSKDEDKIIRFSNINIYVYPNSLNKRLFKVFMNQYYKSDTLKFIGNKELIIELVDGKMKILFED